MHPNPDFNNYCCLSWNTVLNALQTSRTITPMPTAAAQEPRMSALHELLSSGWPGMGREVCELSLQGRNSGIVPQDCKPCSQEAVEGGQRFVPLVLHTHNWWPFKAVLCELSDTSRGTLEKQKGNTSAAHNCFQARGFLVESQVLMAWLCGSRWSCVGPSASLCLGVRRVLVPRQTKIGRTYLKVEVCYSTCVQDMQYIWNN